MFILILKQNLHSLLMNLSRFFDLVVLFLNLTAVNKSVLQALTAGILDMLKFIGSWTGCETELDRSVSCIFCLRLGGGLPCPRVKHPPPNLL